MSDISETARKNNRIEIAQSAVTENVVFDIRGSGATLIIEDGARVGGRIFLSDNAKIVIGARSIIHQAAFHLHEGSEVQIGERCLFSRMISVRPSDAHKIFDLDSGERINSPKPIIVGDHVWVGEKVDLMKGAQIPSGCVVGSSAYVVSAFEEENCIIGGNPAKVLRRGVRWDF